MEAFVWVLSQNYVEIQGVENQIYGLVYKFLCLIKQTIHFSISTQLCVSVQMKYSVTSGETGTVIYIDTEGSFVPIRLQTMTMAAENENHSNPTSVEQILKNVTYFRCVNVAELIACLIQLKQIMTPERNVKLIILDSLAHPIRSIIDGDNLTRHKHTVRIVTMLQKLASDHQCAVSLIDC
jgi:RecA/RadA recombinase